MKVTKPQPLPATTLPLTSAERMLLLECLTIAIGTMLEGAEHAELMRRPIANRLQEGADQAVTLRDRIRRL